MQIEDEVFLKSKPDYSKLIEYGFIKEDKLYNYSKPFFNNNFAAYIKVDDKGKVVGKVIDLKMNEEYINIHISNQVGSYVSKVKEEYKIILEDIKSKCFIKKDYISDQTSRIIKYIKDKYHNDMEFLWDNYSYGVFKNKKNKWYAIIMDIDGLKISNINKKIEIMNVKLDPDMINKLLKEDGFYKAYHMNKKYWITIVLDDIIQDDIIFSLIDCSYKLVL